MRTPSRRGPVEVGTEKYYTHEIAQRAQKSPFLQIHSTFRPRCGAHE